MSFIADLHIHSKYSRATSRDCDLEHLSAWAQRKGISVIGTGDFTHPAWMAELSEKLVPAEPGLFRLNHEIEKQVASTLPAICRSEVRFMLQVEISNIYKKAECTRKVHNLIYAPDFIQAKAFAAKLGSIGNITSDGRPILGLDAHDLLEIQLETVPDGFFVPAHIWTPWFAVLGSKSGFDSIEECFDDLTKYIFAVETGLSSDPAMNWRLSALDSYRLISNSDAHSPAKLGRESCRFNTTMDFFAIRQALATGVGYNGTIEFFPEEGKYHLDGHRDCSQRLSPKETIDNNGLCPTCGKPVTVGVLHRVEELADRSDGFKPEHAAGYKSLVPLCEILGEINRVGATSQTVTRAYQNLLNNLGSEFYVLEHAPLEDIAHNSSSLLVEALTRLRHGKVKCDAGYDGEYGVIRLFEPKELTDTNKTALLFNLPDKVTNYNEKKENTIQDKSEIDNDMQKQDNIDSVKVDPYESEIKNSKDEGLPNKFIPQNNKELESEVTFKKSLLAGLDVQQKQAAQLREGPVIIIAGPGTGKTRTLTHRIAWQIKNGATAEQCLAITFTRRAANELQERLAKLIPDDYTNVTIATFHSLGLIILREFGKYIGLSLNFEVLDAQQQKELIAKAFNQKLSTAHKLREEITRYKRNIGDNLPNDLTGSYKTYQQALHNANAVDFDDLIRLPVLLLKDSQKIKEQLQHRFVWISVDEFQDVDPLQYCLLTLLAPPNANICVIGDPDQSIYAFRGSDVELFWRFTKDYPSTKQIKLNRNYRSSDAIIKAALQAIAPMSLVPAREIEPIIKGGCKLIIHSAASERAEAEFVVHNIEQLLAGHSFFSFDSKRASGNETTNLSFSDFAILFRNNSQSQILCEAFANSGLPVQAPGDDPEVFDPRAEKITLLTLHAAKGLEFKVVFIVGCEDGLIPLRFGNELAASLAEERRLFFVGMTRARDKLFLTRARKRLRFGKMIDTAASPFIDDIEQVLLEKRQQELKRKTQKAAAKQLELL
ncbi:MAG: UvrD-helicase domain-containing protein [Deltaproteobacteria bacterium]|nr:UvrD-helicase domain-containing protein [Deltaproteobacteria bacterium]